MDMDPDACLARLIEAAADGDADELLYAAEDLAEWLRKGGFAPSNPVKGLIAVTEDLAAQLSAAQSDYNADDYCAECGHNHAGPCADDASSGVR